MIDELSDLFVQIGYHIGEIFDISDETSSVVEIPTLGIRCGRMRGMH